MFKYLCAWGKAKL